MGAINSPLSGTDQIKQRLTGLSIGLVLEFGLGVLLGTVAGHQDGAAHQSPLYYIVLTAHIVLAVALIAGSLASAAIARGDRWAFKRAITAVAAIIVAFAGGVGVLKSPAKDWSILVMAAGFMVALVAYNQVLRRRS